ncbi:Hint domain-containing protein [Siccirubricoccus sp. G192]|uniref:Hint domain-containing protein n=1 Tax=Siccirubricoccus sp. G192 TaxID=2849651 RepID=UPI001C2BFDF2|nr:Hint domain-containing protein [Siccirubricoccus sp. G192]MBV1799743.1 Hint domain-containing protein [Siccirubricoccus sp. G192]
MSTNTTTPAAHNVSTTGANNYVLGDQAGSAETFSFAGDGLTYTYLGRATYTGSNTTSGFYASGSDGNQYYFSTSAPQGIANAKVTKTVDAAGPSATTDFAICFYPGTLVRTPSGDAAVEALKIGDIVLTHEGKAASIRWMGHQTVSTLFADPLTTLPIRIRAGALAENLPERDLLVSPAHAILVEGVLVQAGALVNGTSILREAAVPQVFTYHHVELADHALILAEGVPAETFVDNVERAAFDNWAEHEALYGAEAAIPEMDLPRAKAHRQVPMAVRERIAARAEALFGAAAIAA